MEPECVKPPVESLGFTVYDLGLRFPKRCRAGDHVAVLLTDVSSPIVSAARSTLWVYR